MENLLSKLATIAGIAGFGLLGVVVALKWIASKGRNAWWNRRDRQDLGAKYDAVRALISQHPTLEKMGTKRLISHLEEVKNNLTAMIQISQDKRHNSFKNRRASGSVSLLYSDILKNNGLLIPIKFRNESTQATLTTNDIALKIDHIPGKLETKSQPTLILGNAGTGKSLASFDIEVKLTHYLKHSGRWVFSIRPLDISAILSISASEKYSSFEFGSVEWCAALLALRIGITAPSDLQMYLLVDILKNKAVILIDGIDEIFQRLSDFNAAKLPTTWLFLNASLILCRSAFYYYTMYGDASVKDFTLLSIEVASTEDRHSFIQNACNQIHKEDGVENYENIMSLLRENKSLAEVIKVPLLIMMLVEVSGGEILKIPFDGSIAIYEAFLMKCMRRDRARFDENWTSEKAIDILTELAWRQFLQLNDSKEALSHFRDSDVERVLTRFSDIGKNETNAIIENILDSPLIGPQIDFDSNNGLMFDFVHMSFMDFFVARRTFIWLQGTTEIGSDFFEILETPGASHFIKEYFVWIRSQNSILARVESRFLAELNKKLQQINTALSDQDAREASFSAGQIAYYFGMVASKNTKDILVNLCSIENDFWVRRASAIGLAFGGDSAPLNSFLDNLWNEIDNQIFTNARKNIAVELGFYGDQVFDPMDPTRDLGGADCERTVLQIVRQLASTVESPNWRVDLFDLVYLAKYRPESFDDFYSSLEVNKEKINSWFSKAKILPELKETREIHELEMILFPSHS